MRIAALLLSLPAVSLAQQIAIGGYNVPTARSSPSRITVGPDKALWFTEGSGNNIGRINTAGYVTEYPVPTAASGPLGITLGPDRALWFTEYQSGKIGRITPAGTITEYPLPASSYPAEITAGPDGALWFTIQPSSIGRISTAGAITEYTVSPAHSEPLGITPGPDGALWFTEFGTFTIGRITTSGAITGYSLPSGESAPGGITLGPDGALWFTESGSFGSAIGRMTTAGMVTEYTGNGLLNPASITSGPDGALWFTEDAGDNNIVRITTAGVISAYPASGGASGAGIVTGPDGALWFTNQGGNHDIGQAVFTTATLSVSPATGNYGSKLTFTGSGFAPNEGARIYISGVGSTVLGSANADSSGSFTVAAREPPSSNGPRLFLGTGQTSGKLGAASFSVTPRLILEPRSGPVGTQVTVDGYGFDPDNQISITWDAYTFVGMPTSDVDGSLTGTQATFTIPEASPGVHTVAAEGNLVRTLAFFVVQ